MSNPFHGDVLFIDRPTTDGRRIKPGAPIRVRADAQVFACTEEDIYLPRGDVDMVDWPDDHTLTLAGTTDLPPGEYPCGVVLHPMDVELPPSDLTDEELVDWVFNADTVVVGGTVASLTVYLGPGAESQPAWPGTHITVTEGAPTR